MEGLDIPQGEMKQQQRILHINKASKTLCDGKSIFKMKCYGTNGAFSFSSNILF